MNFFLPFSEDFHSCNFSGDPKVVFTLKFIRKSWSPWDVKDGLGMLVCLILMRLCVFMHVARSGLAMR